MADSVGGLIQFFPHDTAQIGFDVLAFNCPTQGVVDQCLISAFPRQGFEVRHDRRIERGFKFEAQQIDDDVQRTRKTQT